MPNQDMPCCPACTKPEDRPIKVEASGACCCFHMPDPNFTPTPEQYAEAEARLVAMRESTR